MRSDYKELVWKDLCARLPHGVQCHFKYGTSEGDIILKCIDGNVARFDYGWYGKFHVVIDPQYIKPYLRTMASMTKAEAKEYARTPSLEKPDWLNEHHFDYRGLIGMGLALEAPEGMYKENIKEYPSIEDFVIGDAVPLPDGVEREINAYIDEYSKKLERREFEAVQKSKGIFLNC